MTPRALTRLLAACTLACATAAQAAEPPKVVITGQRQPATVTIKGVRDPSDWMRAESQHLVVYSDSRVEEVVELVASLERLDQLLRIYLKPFLISPAHAAKPTLVFRQDVRWEDELGERPERARGALISCSSGSQLFGFNLEPIWKHDNKTLNDGYLNAGQIYTNLLYVQQFLLRHTDIRGPSWFFSGFATYLGGARFTDNQMLIGKAGGSAYDLLKRVDDGQHAPRVNFDQLLGEQPLGNALDIDTQWEWLGRAFNLTHYVLSTEDKRQKLLRYLDATNNGERPGKAFADVYGLSGRELERAMWRYRQSQAKVLRIDMPDMPQPTIDITRLSRQEGRFVLPSAALKACPAPQHGRALLERLRTQALPLRTVGLAQMTLSRAEIDWGDPRKALPWLAERSVDDPDDAEAHYLLGLAHLTLAEQAPHAQRADLLAGARKVLTLAAELNGRMPEVSYALYRLALLAPEEPDRQSVARAIAAWRYAHDVPAYARSAALAYAWLGDPAGAFNALNTLARFERDGQGVRWAKAWLERLATGVPRDELLAAMRREARESASYKLWAVQ